MTAGSATVVPHGSTYAFDVTYASGDKEDVTELAVWTSANSTTAAVSDAAGTHGVVRGVSVGSTEVTADFSGFTATASVDVTAAVAATLSITPAAALGGLLWKLAPQVPFVTAGIIGLIGTEATIRQAYVDKLNAAVAEKGLDGSLADIIRRAKADGDRGVFNNAAQHWNHSFYWQCLAPAQGQRFRMVGEVVKPGRTLTNVEGRAYAIDGGREKLIATMNATLMALFGREGVHH